MTITITEALAEIKTIGKRIEKKREFVQGILWRVDHIKDPLDKDGGSFQAIKRERQAIHDLEERIVRLRRGIQEANEATPVSINGTSRSVADWLVWRRDVAPNTQRSLAAMRGALHTMREQAKRQGVNVTGNDATAQRNDVIVNINEQELATEIETLEDTLGQLDGQLSLKNATVLIHE